MKDIKKMKRRVIEVAREKGLSTDSRYTKEVPSSQKKTYNGSVRVLITSTDHRDYGSTGTVVRDLGSGGLEISLERGGGNTVVPEGQFKIISQRELAGRDL